MKHLSCSLFFALQPCMGRAHRRRRHQRHHRQTATERHRHALQGRPERPRIARIRQDRCRRQVHSATGHPRPAPDPSRLRWRHLQPHAPAGHALDRRHRSRSISPSRKPGAAQRRSAHAAARADHPTTDIAVSEGYIWENNGKTTFNDPATWNAPVLSSRRRAEPGSRQRRWPRKACPSAARPRKPQRRTFTRSISRSSPANRRSQISYSMPFTSPGEFDSKVFYKGGPTRVIVPKGVTVAGDRPHKTWAPAP